MLVNAKIKTVQMEKIIFVVFYWGDGERLPSLQR